MCPPGEIRVCAASMRMFLAGRPDRQILYLVVAMIAIGRAVLGRCGRPLVADDVGGTA